MNVWMIVYFANGRWHLSTDFPVRGRTRDAARKYAAKFPDLLKDGSYKIAKFTWKR